MIVSEILRGMGFFGAYLYKDEKPLHKIFLMDQKHTSNFVFVDGNFKPEGILKDNIFFLNLVADAFIVRRVGRRIDSVETGFGVGVKTADCVPILFASKNFYGAIHAGWRGIAKGIIENILSFLKDEDLVFSIGPYIMPCHYEIGPDVFEIFHKIKNSVIIKKKGKIFLDLGKTVENLLRERGIDKIEVIGLCTWCNENFSSRRRDGENVKPFISYIGE